MNILQKIHREQMKSDLVDMNVGDTVKVHNRVVEGGKERIQIFAGIIIGKSGLSKSQSITVRKLSYGEGVERVYPIHSPLISKIEVTKRVDGIERKIGERLPGKLLGEVPLVYGTQFQASGRAAAPSRVMRLDARHYYAIAAASPDLMKKMGELARERIGGLQGIAAETRRAQVTIVGHRWDANCLELRRFLASNQITFDGLTPDAPELTTRWLGTAPTEGDLPALQLADGTTLVRPQPRALAELLGLQTTPRSSQYDTIIVGGGPAGLAAAVYGASEGLRTVVIEREAPGGQAGTSSRIENYLGFPNGISGDELASRAFRQAKRLGAEVLITRRILGIDPESRAVQLDGDEVLEARTIILATGVSWRS